MSRKRRILLVSAAFLAVFALALVSSRLCLSARFRYGITLDQCPAGDVHVALTLNASNLRRGQPGLAYVSANMLYALDNDVSVQSATLPPPDVEMTLVRGDKSMPLKLEPKNGDVEAPETNHARVGFVTLPADLADGDYIIKVKGQTRAGEAFVEAPLPLYAPARIHVITDRPLYEPGHTVKMRAVILRARDLVPLESRPGRFVVTDPSGTVVLEEKADAAEYGVVAGEIPLDKTAPQGLWNIRYESGADSDAVAIEVKPFELPRFTVEVEPVKGFYRPKDEPRVRIKVASAAGVPLSTSLELQWNVASAWPPPPEWIAGMPKSARTDRSGRVELTLPKIPADLMGKAALRLIATATDDAGDREIGQGTVLLAQDAIDVSVVTELGAGGELVQGTNNRAYLRVTTAAGAPLTNASLVVARAWDKSDKGTNVETDEDGVAVLQLDPGPAVNILVPAMPIRLPPPPPVVQRVGLAEVLEGQEPTLAEVNAVDKWNALVAPCARFLNGGQTSVSLRIESSGRIARAATTDAASRCVASALVGRATLPAGGPRVFRVSYNFQPTLASLSHDVIGTGELPQVLNDDLEEALLDARSCLGALTTDSELPRMLVWEVVDGVFSASWDSARRATARASRAARDEHGDEYGDEHGDEYGDDGYDDGSGSGDGTARLDEGRARCVEGKLAAFSRSRRVAKGGASSRDGEDSYESDDGSTTSFGAIRFSVSPVSLPGEAPRPSATTMLGYELKVTAKSGEGEGAELVGDTKVRLRPGTIPNIRLRASPVIATAGDVVTLEILRGPEFTGELPKKMWLTNADGSSVEAEVDKEKRTARFTLPKDKHGWYEARFDAALARVFVARPVSLAVSVKPDKPVYRPGEMAKLAVTTSTGSGPDAKGTPAAVGLFGVDSTLAQVTTLPGADAMERISPTVTMQTPAFGVLDATALSLGRVRGKNAAAATVLLVSSVPVPTDIDVTTSASATTPFDPALPLADRFYTVLEQLYDEVREFEAKAPKEEKLTAAKQLELWDAALAAAKKKGANVSDVFGRELRLSLLPDDLVMLADPRLLVADGTRLPEDVENWVRFVRNARRSS